MPNVKKGKNARPSTAKSIRIFFSSLSKPVRKLRKEIDKARQCQGMKINKKLAYYYIKFTIKVKFSKKKFEACQFKFKLIDFII